MIEIIYILTNPSMEGLIKIGKTKDINKRIKSLNAHTGVPTPFELLLCMQCTKIKKKLKSHCILFLKIINPAKIENFLKLPQIKVIALLELVQTKLIFSLDKQHKTTKKIRTTNQKNFTFSDVNIPKNAIILFAKKPKV